MLEVLRTKDGEIKAVCEWYLVNINGEYDKDGIYCWINECEVSKQFENAGCLREFIKIITSNWPQLQFGYFWRKRKYPNREPRIYSRSRWLKLLGGK